MVDGEQFSRFHERIHLLLQALSGSAPGKETWRGGGCKEALRFNGTKDIPYDMHFFSQEQKIACLDVFDLRAYTSLMKSGALYEHSPQQAYIPVRRIKKILL